MASANKSLGRIDLQDIPPAPRGMPQIEVMFDIDANGILNVSAKDKATGKQQSFVIKASSGLNDDEIQRMVKDAEAHKAEDQKFHERVTARNQADNIIHATEKSIRDFGDKVSADEKSQVESAIAALKAVMDGDDKNAIEEKTRALAELSGKIAERMYQQGQAGGGASAGPGGGEPGGGEAKAEGGQAGEDVVDAEFEEVKEEGRKR
jgi:molecular chaperone DnaK